MSISTRWERDGSLVVKCGEDEIVITTAGLAERKVSSRKGGGANKRPLFLRTITPGEPGFTCNIIDQCQRSNARPRWISIYDDGSCTMQLV